MIHIDSYGYRITLIQITLMALRDDEIDGIYTNVYEELLEIMRSNPDHVSVVSITSQNHGTFIFRNIMGN